jgi:Na+/H+ antiporter NhaD/arsenite permease-like protein
MIQLALRKAASRLKAEPFFLITLAATLALSLISRPHVRAISWNVIAILFSQMLVCGAFEECCLLQSLASWTLGVFKTPKRLGLALVLFTGVLAMLITNDIALFTVVPVTLSMSKITDRSPHLLIILETVSANLFSAVTPFGNPQNLFLFTYYKIPAADFFSSMLPFGLLGVVLLAAAVPLLCRGDCYRPEKKPFLISSPKLLAGALISFAVNILAVLRVTDYRLALAVSVAIFLFLAPKLFKSADYILLLTFVLFFLFTDALTSVPAVRQFFGGLLSTKLTVLFSSAVLSQAISNVPAAVVLSGFTGHARELLYGVSAGGLGTLIASLASLISYKLYLKEYQSEKRVYLKSFFLLNAVFLVLLLAGLTVLEVLSA